MIGKIAAKTSTPLSIQSFSPSPQHPTAAHAHAHTHAHTHGDGVDGLPGDSIVDTGGAAGPREPDAWLGRGSHKAELASLAMGSKRARLMIEASTHTHTHSHTHAHGHTSGSTQQVAGAARARADDTAAPKTRVLSSPNPTRSLGPNPFSSFAYGSAAAEDGDTHAHTHVRAHGSAEGVGAGKPRAAAPEQRSGPTTSIARSAADAQQRYVSVLTRPRSTTPDENVHARAYIHPGGKAAVGLRAGDTDAGVHSITSTRSSTPVLPLDDGSSPGRPAAGDAAAGRKRLRRADAEVRKPDMGDWMGRGMGAAKEPRESAAAGKTAARSRPAVPTAAVFIDASDPEETPSASDNDNDKPSAAADAPGTPGDVGSPAAPRRMRRLQRLKNAPEARQNDKRVDADIRRTMAVVDCTESPAAGRTQASRLSIDDDSDDSVLDLTAADAPLPAAAHSSDAVALAELLPLSTDRADAFLRAVAAARTSRMAVVQASQAMANDGIIGSAAADDRGVSPSADTLPSLLTPALLVRLHGITVGAAITASRPESVPRATSRKAAAAGPLSLAAHQLVGVNWLWHLYTTKGSGVLADAMGLGKSVQTCVLLATAHALRGAAAGPHCIVTPASTLGNWQRELAKWAPELRVGLYRGGATRYEQQSALMRGDASAVSVRSAAANSTGDSAVEVVDVDGEDSGGDDGGYVITCSASESDSFDGRRTNSPVPDPSSQRSGTRTGFDVLLTTYTLFDRSGSGPAADRAWLRKIDWDCLILDEGHAVKNVGSARHRHLSALKAQHRFLLSGTPVQNTIAELLALLHFIDPETFDNKVARAFATATADIESEDTSPHQRRVILRLLRRVLDPFILRRDKETVLASLPRKTDAIVTLTMDDWQRRVYKSLVSAAKRRVGNADSSSTVAESPARAIATDDDAALYDCSERTSGQIFTDLRKVAQHPLLQRHWYRDRDTLARIGGALVSVGAFAGEEAGRGDRVMQELESMSDWDIHELCWQYSGRPELSSPEDDALRRITLVGAQRAGPRALLRTCCLPRQALLESGKIRWLAETLPVMLDVSKAGYPRKVLIFSQWTRVLDILGFVLEQELGIPFVRLDGSTPVAERQPIIDRFTSDACVRVFLLSTRAGGLGLNLVAADTVIMYDLDLNPHVDAQAVDRVHRIGQTREVTVHRLVARETTDELILRIATKKAELDAALRAAGQADGAQGGGADGELVDDSALREEAEAIDVTTDELLMAALDMT